MSTLMIIHMGVTMKAEEWPTLCLTELVYRSKEIVRGSFIKNDIYEHKIHSVEQLEEISQSELNGGGNIFRIGLSGLSHLLKPLE
jgi:hypothetical protein